MIASLLFEFSSVKWFDDDDFIIFGAGFITAIEGRATNEVMNWPWAGRGMDVSGR
jgi:hypothetical protein